MKRAWGSWWFTPFDAARIAVLRVLAYAFVPIDVLVTTRWISNHRYVPGDLYRPVLIGRLLHLPVPTEFWVRAVQVTVLAAAVGALVLSLRRVAPRLLGWTVAAAYLWWMVIGQSYGKVDHDRYGFIVLLFVLPTVGSSERRGPSVAAGWAIRMVQAAVVATYALSAWAKLRFGGVGWANSATLTRAVLRRGTAMADWTLQVPGFLRGFQWFILAFELGSVVLLVTRPRRTHVIVGLLFAFHLMTFLMLRIIFLPHLVALTAFLPLERLTRSRRTDVRVATPLEAR